MITSALNLLKSPIGKVLALILVALVLLAGLNRGGHKVPEKPTGKPSKLPAVAASTEGIRPEPLIEQNAVTDVRREFSPFPVVKAEEVRVEKPVQAFVPLAGLIQSFEREAPRPQVAVTPVKEMTLKLPPGLLIQCRLFNGIESNLPETPLIARTTQDVRLEGKVLVPAGTEVHGAVRADDQRMRVMTGNIWQLVTPRGQVIRASGIGLNREYDPRKGRFGPEDGFAGIRGVEIRQDAEATKGVMAASALSAAGRLGQETTRTIFGDHASPSLQNGAFAGAAAVTDRLAEAKMREVERKRPFIRVPAGAEFYLYTQAEAVVAAPLNGSTGIDPILSERARLLETLQGGENQPVPTVAR